MTDHHEMMSWCFEPQRLMLAAICVPCIVLALQFYASKDGGLRTAMIAHFSAMAWCCAFWVVFRGTEPSTCKYIVSVAPVMVAAIYLMVYVRRNF